jgi:signal peptidase I
MKGWMKALLWGGLVLGIVFGILRYWFIAFHRVPDDANDVRNWSNAPNLEPGDLALVWRGSTPHAGDLVRCADPNDPSRWFVGRVIGLPGDKIEVNEGGVKVNGFRLRTLGCSQSPRKVTSPEGGEVELGCSAEEVGASTHDVYSSKEIVPITETVVEPGKFFLMSDNRVQPWSYDSRSQITQMPVEACTQRLVMRLWSKKGWGDSERRMTFLF